MKPPKEEKSKEKSENNRFPKKMFRITILDISKYLSKKAFKTAPKSDTLCFTVFPCVAHSDGLCLSQGA